MPKELGKAPAAVEGDGAEVRGGEDRLVGEAEGRARRWEAGGGGMAPQII